MHKLLCAPRDRVEFPTIWLTLLDNYKVNSNCIANRHLAAPTLRGTEKNDINHGFSRINTDRPERKKIEIRSVSISEDPWWKQADRDGNEGKARKSTTLRGFQRTMLGCSRCWPDNVLRAQCALAHNRGVIEITAFVVEVFVHWIWRKERRAVAMRWQREY